MSNEVLWTKFLSLTIGTSTYALSIILFSFLIGLAIGSYIIGKHLDKIKHPITFLAFIELGIGLSCLIVLLFIDNLDVPYLILYSIFHNSLFLFEAALLLFIFLILSIPTMLMGATLPVMEKISTKNVKQVGTTVGEIFSVNTLGGLFGAFTAGFVFIKSLGLIKTGVVALAINLMLAKMVFDRSERKWSGHFSVLFISSMFLCLYVMTLTYNPISAGAYYDGIRGDLEDWQFSKNSRSLLYQDSNEYGIVSVWRTPTHDFLSINGKVDGGTGPDSITQYFLGYLPLFARPDAKKVLGIGLGTGATLSAVENFDVERIDWVEINPLVVEASREYFSEYNDHALDDTRLNLVIEDGRNYLLYSEEKYDVITSEPSNIWVGGSSALFTDEFFRSIKNNLAANGIFTCWIPGYETSEEDLKILLNTIHQEFSYVYIWKYESDLIILACDTKIEMDYYSLLDCIYQNDGIYSDFLELDSRFWGEEYSSNNLEKSILDGYLGEYSFMEQKSDQVNTDDLPILEYSTFRNSITKSAGYDLEFSEINPIISNETVWDHEIFILPQRTKAGLGNVWEEGKISYSINSENGVIDVAFSNSGSTITIKAVEFNEVHIYPEDSSTTRLGKELLAESKIKKYSGNQPEYEKSIINNHSYLIFRDTHSTTAGWVCWENSRIYVAEVIEHNNPDEIIKHITCYHSGLPP